MSKVVYVRGIQMDLSGVAVSERQIRVALGEEDPSATIINYMVNFKPLGVMKTCMHIPDGNLIMAVNRLVALCDQVIRSLGRVRVRFLQDLKPTDYRSDVHFFHLTEKLTCDEFRDFMRDAVTNPGDDGVTRMVNVGMVRDVEVKLSSQIVSDIHRDYTTIMRFIHTVKNALETTREI